MLNTGLLLIAQWPILRLNACVQSLRVTDACLWLHRYILLLLDLQLSVAPLSVLFSVTLSVSVLRLSAQIVVSGVE